MAVIFPAQFQGQMICFHYKSLDLLPGWDLLEYIGILLLNTFLLLSYLQY